ncbi:MAG: hypothetical protein LBU60_05920 [Clostridiales bacterium]|jgi:hypothetical protein|nr:hypothetical protein [Clostridiales bacterium]
MRSVSRRLFSIATILFFLTLSVTFIATAVYLKSNDKPIFYNDVQLDFIQSDNSPIVIKTGDQIALQIPGKENGNLSIQRKINNEWVEIENGLILAPTTYDGFVEGEVFLRWTTNSDTTSSEWPRIISDQDKDGITLYAVWKI